MIARAFRFIAPAALFLSTAARAQDAAPTDSGDTAWLLGCALLLMLAVGGAALHVTAQAGSRSRITAGLTALAAAAAAALAWVLAGYSLAFAPGGGVLGGGLNVGLRALAVTREGLATPESGFALFQIVAVALAAALLSGAATGRGRLGWLAVFAALWALVVAAPIAHWLSGDGWLAHLGIVDAAGGLSFHLTLGTSALVLALFVGRRLEPAPRRAPGAGLALIVLGLVALIGGSTGAAGEDAASALLNGLIAAAAGLLTALVARRDAPATERVQAAVLALVASLAAISAAAPWLGPLGALLTGIAGTLLALTGARFFDARMNADDPLHLAAAHGLAGAAGALLLAPLVSERLGGAGYEAGISVESQWVAQLIGVAVVAGWAALGTLILALGLSVAGPPRVTKARERRGLDHAAEAEPDR
jgi:Amt family ammonium transporter